MWIGVPILLFLLAGGIVAGASALHGLAILNEARALKAELLDIVATGTAAGLDVDRATVETLDRRLEAATARIVALRADVKGDFGIRVLRRLPGTSDQVIAGDRVFSAAERLLEVGKDALIVARQYAAIREQQAADPRGRSAMAALVALMATSQDEVDRIDSTLNRAKAILAKVPAGAFGPIEDARALMVEKVNQYAPLIASYAQTDDLLPAILGWDAPKRYLVLAQNPAELRPTGGFIGTYGIVTFDKGRITERKFEDVFKLDVDREYPYVQPPDALDGHLLGGQSWQLADANWSPDFPTAAQVALALYTNESGDADIHGVVGLTTYAIDSLLAVTGPVRVDLYDTTVRSGETTLVALQQTRQEPVPGVNRKAFLDAFAAELLDSLLALPPKQWTKVLDQLQVIGRERTAMIWLADEDAQSLISDLGWDGSVGHDSGDFVYVVDANVAPVSKLNAVTSRRVEVDVALDDAGTATHTARVTWQNDIEAPGNKAYRELPTVGDLRILGNYVRLLVPDGSTFLSLAGGSYGRLTGPEEISQEAGRSVFGSYLAIPPGSTSLVYRWTTAAATITQGEDFVYRLTVQKQPGVADETLGLSIVVPEGARIVDASEGLEVKAGATTFVGRLTEDLKVTIRYRFDAPLITPAPGSSATPGPSTAPSASGAGVGER